MILAIFNFFTSFRKGENEAKTFKKCFPQMLVNENRLKHLQLNITMMSQIESSSSTQYTSSVHCTKKQNLSENQVNGDYSETESQCATNELCWTHNNLFCLRN